MNGIVAQSWQEVVPVSDAHTAWQTGLAVGVGLIMALAVVAAVLLVCWLLEYCRRPPPPPKSIVSAKPDRRRQYTGKIPR
jgi:hypothetical protein